MKSQLFWLIIIVSMFLSPTLAAQTNSVINGDFETGDFTGWTTVDSGGGELSIYSGEITPISGHTIPAPPNGQFASVSDQFSPSSFILYQDITIPSDVVSANLTFLLYYRNYFEVWLNDGSLSHTGVNQHLRIDIMDPDAPVDDVDSGVLLNILLTADDDSFEFGYELVEANLDAFIGQTIRIRFAEVGTESYFNMAIDDVAVSVQHNSIPVPANHPLALLLLVFGILMLAAIGIGRFGRTSRMV